MGDQSFPFPTDSQSLLDAELQRLCGAVRGEHAAKMRYTAIRYGIARGTPGVAEDSIFCAEADDADLICARSTWYGKWKKRMPIRRIWEYVEELVRTHREQETVAVELEAQQQMRRAIAEGATDAVQGLRSTALAINDRADYRTDASKTLITLFDEGLGARLAMQDRGTPLSVEVENLDDLIEGELARVSGAEGV